MSSSLNLLQSLRNTTRLYNKFNTTGLSLQNISKFLENDHAATSLSLSTAIVSASNNLQNLLTDSKKRDLLNLDEESQVSKLQNKFLNFYEKKYINPYVPLAAKGPWIITTFGSVIYDTGPVIISE